jgi:hypothetical protein
LEQGINQREAVELALRRDMYSHTKEYVNSILWIKSHPLKSTELKRGVRPHADDAAGRSDQVDKAKEHSQKYVDRYLEATQ